MSQDKTKLCPFMSRPEGDRLCEKEKCMAWGKWNVDSAYRGEYKRVGCTLLKDSIFNGYEEN